MANGTSRFGTIVTDAGAILVTDNMDVSGKSVLYFGTGTGTITGLSGGVSGQRIKLVGVNGGGDITLPHNDAGGTQKFLTRSQTNEGLTSYGNADLYCDGTFWWVDTPKLFDKGFKAEDGNFSMEVSNQQFAMTSAQNVSNLYITGTGNSSSANILLTCDMDNASGNGSHFALFTRSSEIGSITQASTASVAYNTTSDERLKENFQDFTALDMIYQMNPVKYSWIEREDQDVEFEYGFKAQELHNILPHVVKVGDEGVEVENPWSVDYSKITPVLAKAIKEQQELIESLKTRIETLENQ